MHRTNKNLYEYETQFFGFSPKGFVDTVYNIIVEAWTKVVQEEIIPRIPVDGLDGVQLSNLKKQLVLLICKNNRLERVMDKLEQHLLTYVFRVPDFLTLPEDLPNLEVDERFDEVQEITKRTRTLENKIIELRLAEKMLDDEIRNTEKVLDMMQEIETTAKK